MGLGVSLLLELQAKQMMRPMMNNNGLGGMVQQLGICGCKVTALRRQTQFC